MAARVLPPMGLVVCEGGPLDHHWMLADEFTARQKAAAVAGGLAAANELAYHPTTPFRAVGHPQFEVDAHVLVYDPTYPATPGDHDTQP
jgi:hypothetical protein